MAQASDIPALVRHLRSPRRLEQVQAAEALAHLLAGDTAAAQALLATGGCAALASMLVSSSSQAAQRAAARALNVADCMAFLAGDGVAAQFAIELGEEAAGRLSVLRALLQGSDSELREAAAWLVCHMANVSQERLSAVVTAGAPTALLGYLSQHTGSSKPLQCCSAYCALTLAYLCRKKTEVQQAIAASGGAAVLVPLLVSSSPLVQNGAAECVRWLASDCPEGQQAAVAAGAIPALAQLLGSNSIEPVSIAAMYALQTLQQHWSADVRQVVGSIPGLVRILQHSEEGDDQLDALEILFSIFDKGSLAELRAMAAAGAAPALQHFLTLLGQDEAAAELVNAASILLDALNRLPDR